MVLDKTQPIKQNFNETRLSPAHTSLVRELTSAKQFTVLQDTGGTSHGGNDTSIKDNKHNSLTFLSGPQGAEALKQAGVKNLALEVRKEFQPIADKVAKGLMTPEQYAQTVADMYVAAGDTAGAAPSARNIEIGRMIKSMGAAGIKVWCVEGQAAGLKEHGQMVDTIDAVKNVYAQAGQSDYGVGDLAKAAVLAAKAKISSMSDGSMFPTVAQERVRLYVAAEIKGLNGAYATEGEMFKKAIEDRMKGDIQLAKTIKSLVGNEKTAVYYGSAHGAYGYDLDEALGGAKKIGLYGTTTEIKGDMQYSYMQREQTPDAAISISDGKSFNKDQLDKMILKDAPQVPASATPVLTKPER